jgi:undecaprenyl-diphosphatase
MDPSWLDLAKAIVLGVIGGLTEFLPVSSEGHLLLAAPWLGLDAASGRGLAALVELAALLALLGVFFRRLLGVALALPTDPMARRFVAGLAIASLPAAVVGMVAHEFAQRGRANLWLVCFALIAGGALLLWLDRVKPAERYTDALRFPLPMCLLIGLVQIAAIVPGVSRAGAIVCAALVLGADRKVAAEYSLWLAMPSLAGGLAWGAYQNGLQIGSSPLLAAAAFAAAFLVAWPVARSFPDYAARRGLKLFAWWRVLVGTLGLIALG